MKLTVIGSQGAYPAPNRPSSGYLIQHEGFSMMLDMGSGVLMKLHDYIDINELNAVIISHYHPDHIADIGCLQHAVKVQTDIGKRNTPLPMYGWEGDPFFKSLTYHGYTSAIPVGPEQPLDAGPFHCEFLETIHPAVGFSIKITAGNRKIVYTGDTGWNENLIGFAEGCDLLLCESSLFNKFGGMVEGHLTAGEAGLIAKKASVKRFALCHFPHYGTIEDLRLEAEDVYRGKVETAEPGSVYDLPGN